MKAVSASLELPLRMLVYCCNKYVKVQHLSAQLRFAPIATDLSTLGSACAGTGFYFCWLLETRVFLRAISTISAFESLGPASNARGGQTVRGTHNSVHHSRLCHPSHQSGAFFTPTWCIMFRTGLSEPSCEHFCRLICKPVSSRSGILCPRW